MRVGSECSTRKISTSKCVEVESTEVCETWHAFGWRWVNLGHGRHWGWTGRLEQTGNDRQTSTEGVMENTDSFWTGWGQNQRSAYESESESGMRVQQRKEEGKILGFGRWVRKVGKCNWKQKQSLVRGHNSETQKLVGGLPWWSSG